MSPPGVSAIVLAGGRSSRFGRDKLAEIVDGRTLLEHALDGVAPLADETIVVVAPDEARRVPAGSIVVSDPASFQGPLVGLLTGLRLATGPLVLVVGGDMPTMVPSVLALLVDRLDEPAVDAAVLEESGQDHPLPGVLRAAPAMVAAERLVDAGERSLRGLYEALASVSIDEASWHELDPGGRTLRDVDTPADLG
jgi:molybdopterin-guanine dinucleotide biosynthesis protein A